MQNQLVVVGLFCAALSSAAQQGNLADWPKLIKNNDAVAARELCTPFEKSKVLAEQVESEKCLANAALVHADAVHLEKDENGQAIMFDEYIPEAVDESLSHLDRGIQLAPQDLSIHQGRLHVLEISRRYDEMRKALEESCTIYKGKGVPDAWLDYTAELMDVEQFNVDLELLKILDAHYPNNPDILGNMGAVFSMLKRDAEAIEVLKRATELAPKDPINAWDLGHGYDYAGKFALADQWYQKSLSIDTDSDRLRDDSCKYGAFVEEKLKERDRACRIEKENCAADRQTACAVLAGPQ